MKRLFVVLAFSVVFVPMSGGLMAQDFSDLISGSKKDANYLMGGYVSPFMKAIGAGFNQGWYNTAKSHKKFGFDLTISVAEVGIPDDEKMFTVDNSKLNTIYLTADHSGSSAGLSQTAGKGKVPTIFGPKDTQSMYDYKSPAPSSPFDGVGGVGINSLPMKRLPAPVVNLGIGLPMNTDLKIRFASSGSLSSDVKFTLWGIGVLHDVKQYIPGLKNLPFDLSAFVGFTKMKIEANLNDNVPSQVGQFNVTATTIQGLISKKISVLTFYGGAGYNFTSSLLKAKGNYDLDSNTSTPDVKDPVNLTTALNGPRASAGMRLKLAIFTFHGDYTFQKYPTFTAGFGISVR